MSSNLEGRIKGLSLPAFLQMSEMEENSCTLKVTSNRNETGYLHLLKGKVISAETGDLKNLEAVYKIISWEEPVIEIRKEVAKSTDEIKMPLMNILMDSLRVKDEQQAERTGSSSYQETSPSEGESSPEETELTLDLTSDSESLCLETDEESGITGSPEDPVSPVVAPNGASETKKPPSDEVIEQRIRLFEDRIAIQCPLCGAGRILQKTGEKQRIHYACSNPNCGFISWEKPYILPCPQCANPFLIEWFDHANSAPGLKCPRMDCSFRRNTLAPPLSPGQSGGRSNGSPSKTYRIIRKKAPR